MYTLHLYTENQELKELYQQQSLKKKYSGDAGIDLYLPNDIHASDHTRSTLFVDHEVVCWMTTDVPYSQLLELSELPSLEYSSKDVSYYLYPRSSISTTPFRLANSVGIIDSGYRGNIIAALDYRHDNTIVPKHSRLVQLCAPSLQSINLVVHNDPPTKTDRGSKGFGSTGR